jgi:uncharacterized protein (DUF2235 family)
VDNLIWEVVKIQFVQYFKAALTVSLVIQTLPEIRQKDNESVQCVSRCVEVQLEVRIKTDVLKVPILLQFNAAEMVAYNAIEEEDRTRITRGKNTASNNLQDHWFLLNN